MEKSKLFYPKGHFYFYQILGSGKQGRFMSLILILKMGQFHLPSLPNPALPDWEGEEDY
jgi:hypothetical protein